MMHGEQSLIRTILILPTPLPLVDTLFRMLNVVSSLILLKWKLLGRLFLVWDK